MMRKKPSLSSSIASGSSSDDVQPEGCCELLEETISLNTDRTVSSSLSAKGLRTGDKDPTYNNSANMIATLINNKKFLLSQR
ncbi:hypothetical protein HanIR_Chr14g0727191 [Helianthus annuus]|nr:hypothetical protein HanIR_Chr14g0727191 [Helianthus annuus]